MTDLTCDVVVVGAGIAGFSAAVRAAETGATVLLIDKSDGALGDGNILMTSGSFRAGGMSPRSDPSELYRFVMSEGIARPDLARAWADNCGRAVDWLANCGVTVAEPAPGRIWLEPESEISLAPVYKKDVGRRVLTKLKARFERFNGRYLNRAEGLALILENGGVRGVVGKKPEGTFELRSRATVLATGGFSANKEMVRRHIGANADNANFAVQSVAPAMVCD